MPGILIVIAAGKAVEIAALVTAVAGSVTAVATAISTGMDTYKKVKEARDKRQEEKEED